MTKRLSRHVDGAPPKGPGLYIRPLHSNSGRFAGWEIVRISASGDKTWWYGWEEDGGNPRDTTRRANAVARRLSEVIDVPFHGKL